jgi:hypothetical protein
MLLQFIQQVDTTFNIFFMMVVVSSLVSACTSIVASCLAPSPSDISITDRICAGPQAVHQAVNVER